MCTSWFDLFYCEVYLDDIIVHSGNLLLRFLFRLREVKQIRKFKLTVKPSKCSFGMPKVEYCGRKYQNLVFHVRKEMSNYQQLS
jgi:hypothetical protein